TFLVIESHKILDTILIDDQGNTTRDWKKISAAVHQPELTQAQREVALTHAANILGHTFEELVDISPKFALPEQKDRFLHLIYYMGKLAYDEIINHKKHVITFTPVLRERLGHHIHGEIWADKIKHVIRDNGLLNREVHIISAN